MKRHRSIFSPPSQRRGESLVRYAWLTLLEMSPGLAELNGPQKPWASVLTFSQLEKSFRAERRRQLKTLRAEAPRAWKRPSAQSSEGIESPSAPKGRGQGKDLSCESRRPWASLHVLKSRRPPIESPSAPKRRGRGKTNRAEAEG